MAVIHQLRMAVQVNVICPVMVVLVHVPPLSEQLDPQQPTQNDEHDAHGKLRDRFDWLRNPDMENEYNGSDKQQHQRMTQTPTQSDQTRCTPVRPLRQDGRYSGDVVRIQGMTKPEDETKH